jgi:hypothetical protein
MDAKELEKALKGRSYQELYRLLSDAETRTLIGLLDSRSVRIGDSAADVLARRRETEAVVDAILEKSLTTRLGKIRALTVLHQFGKKCPRSKEAHLALIDDKNYSVVCEALWGLVFMQDKTLLPVIQAAMVRAGEDSEAFLKYELAITAIRSRDPYFYSPDFWDHMNVWELRKDP